MKETKRKYEQGSYNAVAVLLVIVFASVCYLVFGLLISAYVLQADIWSGSAFLTVIGNYIAVNIPQLLLFAAVLFGSYAIMHTDFVHLVTEKHFRFRLFFTSGLVSLAVMLVFSLVFSRDSSFLAGVWKERLMILPLVLIVTPVQCIAEELYFRVLPARLVLGGKTLKADFTTTVILSLFSGFIFLLPHMGNNEFKSTDSIFLLCLYYASYGVLAMFISLYTHGFEISFGIHIAINLYTALISGYSSSTLQGYPLFIKEGVPSLLLTDLQLFVIFILTFLSVTRMGKKHLEKEGC